MSASRSPIPVTKGITRAAKVQLKDGNGDNAVDQYDGTESMTAFAWPGDDQAQSFSLTASWVDGPLGLVNLTIPGSNTDDSDDGIYQWLIQLADGTAVLARGTLNLAGYPGDGLPGLPDTTSLSYIQLALSGTVLSEAQADYLPYAVHAASDLVRRYCRRNFNRATCTLYQVPSLDGQVLLDQFPVNSITRISVCLDTALAITASPNDFQVAFLSFTSTGDYADSSTPQVYTGIQLTSVASGVQTVTPILFADNLTIQDLANSINAVSGWTATLGLPGYGSWPTSEIYCQDGGGGALTGQGINLQVFSQDIFGRVDHRTGMLNLGSNYNSVGLGPTWGPDWVAFDYPSLSPMNINVARVIYDAGFDVVPPMIQQATAQVSKVMLQLFANDYLLKSESIGAYKYELRDVWQLLPTQVQQALNMYQAHNA